jgi:VWFA-related protein
MVQVSVVVHGKKNEPVAGLTKDDFEIYDAGVKQQVATLAVDAPLPAEAAASAQAAKRAHPNVFTNETGTQPGAPKTVTVILMDGLNTRMEHQAYARQQLVKFLHTLTADDRVALYSLGRELRILHDFTEDPQVLLKALDRSHLHLGPELADSNPAESNSGNDDLDKFLDGSNEKLADFQTVNRVGTTLNAIEAIAQHLAQLPGRKNLIWISGGFPLDIGMDEMVLGSTSDRRMFTDEMEHATRAVTAAGLAIYPVDARGLMTNPDNDAAAPTGKNALRRPPGPSKAMLAIQKTHSTMRILAERTGGKAYLNSNDLKAAIRGAIDDSKLTYVLGYYPTHGTWDGKFHELKVRVNQPGVNVRHRLGYFAFAAELSTAQARKAALQEAAWSPLDAAGIAMAVRLAPGIPEPGNLRLDMVVQPRDLSLQPKDGRWVGGVDLVFIQRSGPDQPPVFISKTIDLNLSKATYESTMKQGLALRQDFKSADTGYRLKVVVRDVTSGNVGSVNMRTDKLRPLEAPKK